MTSHPTVGTPARAVPPPERAACPCLEGQVSPDVDAAVHRLAHAIETLIDSAAVGHVSPELAAAYDRVERETREVVGADESWLLARHWRARQRAEDLIADVREWVDS